MSPNRAQLLTICRNPIALAIVAGLLLSAVTLAMDLRGKSDMGGVTESTEAPAELNSETIVAHSVDRRPSSSASDWVTYADSVAVVTPIAETEIAPSDTEVERGEGLILRDLTLRVDSVLWRSPIAERVLPSQIQWTAFGSAFFGGDVNNRQEMASEGQPRLEVGHTYILALDWQAPRCTAGDRVEGGWRGLGGGAMLPYDNAVIGSGEFEGDLLSANTISFPDEGSLRDTMTGESASKLAQSLSNARPSVPETFELPRPCIGS